MDLFSENMFGNGVSSRSSEAELIEMVFHQETEWDMSLFGGRKDIARERTSRELYIAKMAVLFPPLKPQCSVSKNTTRDRWIKENCFGSASDGSACCSNGSRLNRQN